MHIIFFDDKTNNEKNLLKIQKVKNIELKNYYNIQYFAEPHLPSDNL